MPDTKDQLPIERLHSEEVTGLYSLFAISQELINVRKRLEKRLRRIPNAWRDIAMLQTVTDKVLMRVLETMPTEKLAALRRNMKHMAYRIYLTKPLQIPEDECLINAHNLTTLLKSAHEYRCVACDNNCNTCDLGKTMDQIMVQTRKRGESWSWIDIDREYDDKDVIR